MSRALEKLQAAKAHYNEFMFLDLSALGLAAAHRALGEAVAGAARRTLAARLDALPATGLALKLAQARACRAWLAQRAQDPALPRGLSQAVDEYLAALEAWGEGLGLASFAHPALRAGVGGPPVTPNDLAMFMQHDNTGCQTGLYRQADGAVILWHGEEDVHPQRFDRLRIAQFTACPAAPPNPQPLSWPGRAAQPGARPANLFAFIYPDLLPGPAFAWRDDGYAQAVDLLILRAPPRYPRAALANVLAWLAWRLGPAWNPADMARWLGPYYDAYGLNALGRGPGRVWASGVEYGAGQVIEHAVAEAPGSHSFQVNVFRRRDDPALADFEKLSGGSEHFFARRTARTLGWLARKPVPEGAQAGLAYFLDLLRSRHGGEGSYANADVRAHFLARLAPGGPLEVWLGPGPALKGERVQKMIYGSSTAGGNFSIDGDCYVA